MKFKPKLTCLLSLVIVFCSSTSFAQIQNTPGTWLSLYKVGDFTNSDKNSYELYIQDRAYADADKQNLINLGGQIRHKIKNNQFLGLGYQWYHDVDQSLFSGQDENRFIESYHIIFPQIDRSFLLRSQLEERKENASSNWNFVLREKLEFNKTLTNYEWISSDEIFINLNHPDWVSSQTFYENRASTGVSIKLNTDTKLFLGYLNRYLLDDPNNEMQHILVCTLIFT